MIAPSLALTVFGAPSNHAYADVSTSPSPSTSIARICRGHAGAAGASLERTAALHRRTLLQRRMHDGRRCGPEGSQEGA